MSFFLIYYMCGDFMTEEMYRRLNNYLNDIFLELNKEDMVILNDKINSEEYSYLGVSEILDTIGIEINNETINETLNIIKNSIYNQKREKAK